MIATAADAYLEQEAISLLRAVSLSIDDFARFFRLEPAETAALLADPTAMRALVRLQLALTLEHHATQTPNPAWSHAVAETIWHTARASFAVQAHALLAETLIHEPEQLEARFAAFMLEQLGPEVFEFMPDSVR